MKLPRLVLASTLALCGAAAPARSQTTPAPAVAPAAMPREVLPVPDPAAIRLRPPASAAAEQWIALATGDHWVRNVVDPTLTPYLPAPGRASGAAVVVMPGGAFRFVSIDSEGTTVARWFADHGVAAFLLKYRTVPTPRALAAFGHDFGTLASALTRSPDAISVTPEAVADATAALQLVRARARDWAVDPAKIGMIGFSAGAMTTLRLATAPPGPARPDFAVAIYGPMEPMAVPPGAPPLFAAVALDDEFFVKDPALGLIGSWRHAGAPIEAHLYGSGRHGFGFAGSSQASRLWTEELLAWLRDRALVPSSSGGAR